MVHRPQFSEASQVTYLPFAITVNCLTSIMSLEQKKLKKILSSASVKCNIY